MNVSINQYPLNKISSVMRGVTFARKEGVSHPHNDFLPVLRAGNIQDSLLTDEDLIWVPKSKISNIQVIQKNDIIMCTSSGSPHIVGKVAIAELDWEGSFGAFCAGIRADEKKCIPKFLFYYLKSPIFKSWCKNSSGVNIKNIRKSSLENYKIPLPPLDIQKKIATVLDKADQLRQKRKKAIEKLDQLIQSVFLDMFGDPVLNPKGWKKNKIKTFVKKIHAGFSIGGEQRKKENGELGVLKISAVTKGEFLSGEYKTVKKNQIKKAMIHPRKGDVLFSRANTRELVAATCIVDKNYPDLFLPDKLWKIELNETVILPYFFKNVLSNERYRKELTKKATGTSGSMLNISQEKLKNNYFPIPPIQPQKRFSCIVEKIENLKNRMKITEKRLEEQFNSLLQQAFKGELKFNDKAFRKLEEEVMN